MAGRLHSSGGMLPQRSFATGLFGMACCIGLFWQVRGESLPDTLLRSSSAPAEPAAAPGPAERGEACSREAPAVNVVDVAAAAATPELVAQLIRVGEGERVTAVDDHPVGSDLEAGAWIAARFHRGPADARLLDAYARDPLGHGGFLDVTLERARCSRRVLVLLH